jgi:DNA-binding response OmpR family regulator
MSSTSNLPYPQQPQFNTGSDTGIETGLRSQSAQPGTAKAKRILLVEDDRSTSNALRQLLTAYGYQVLIVGTVADAIAAIDDSLWGVILDLMLPDGDGAEVLRKIRSMGAKTRVCITTGVSSPVWLQRVQALSPDCILQKPIDLAQLLEKL